MTGCSYVNKLGYMLETPLDPQVLATKGGSENSEVRTISRKGSHRMRENVRVGESSETARRATETDQVSVDDTVRSA